MSGKSFVEKELSAPSVFKDESKLSPDYVPPSLLHREEELRILARTFRSLAEAPGEASYRLILRGPIGSGKTALAKRFGSDFEAYVRKKKINFKYVHVNCREEGSFYGVLKNIIRRNFERGFPSRGYSSQELLSIFIEILDKNNLHVLLALDELEALIRKEGGDPLFSLTRLYEGRPPGSPQRLSLICIFREPECEEAFKLLDASTLSTLGHNTVKLEGYTSGQLKEILEYRVHEAFQENAVEPEALELAADLAGETGDARFAIELLWLGGKFADTARSPRLLPEHIRAAQMNIHPSLRREDLKLLSLHEKLLLLAVARALRLSQTAYLPIGDVEKEYSAVCEEYREKPRAHTQTWKYVKTLGMSGMMSTKISGKGQRGKTTLLGLYVSSERLEEELRRMLESKKHG
ncbi:ORC1-type DNA replication protein [Candidatus Hecatella orcuttiae]|uniref:ORC1-type DNA replication protein n=1 Tax=Candidatus Hecatella orcuttiae TaxID=1935119 RepID=UPI002867EDEF|nr:ORC1-type DNA replication protein [Candidatus Hecatella orcuttiae]